MNDKYIICFFSIENKNNYEFDLQINDSFKENPYKITEDKQKNYNIITFRNNLDSKYKIIIKNSIDIREAQTRYSTNEFEKISSQFDFKINPIFKNLVSKNNFTNFEILILLYNYINNNLKKFLGEKLIEECKKCLILNQYNEIIKIKKNNENIELLYFIKILILLYEQFEETNELYISNLFENFKIDIFNIKKNIIDIKEEKKKIDNFLEDLNENSEKYNYIKNQIEKNSEFSNQIEILILYYYREYNFENFINYLLKNKYFEFIKQNENKIGNFEKEEYSKIISKIEDINDLKRIIDFLMIIKVCLV